MQAIVTLELGSGGPRAGANGGRYMIGPEVKKRTLSFEERIAPASTALVVVDVQNDFAAPEGVCGMVGDDLSSVPGMVGRLVRLIESARKAGVLIVYLRTASRDFMPVVATDSVATHDANRIQHDASLRVLADCFAVTGASTEIIGRWREHEPLRASA